MDEHRLLPLLTAVPVAALPAAMARVATDATVVAGAAVSAEGRSALAALANSESVASITAAVLQVQFLGAETLAWQSFRTGDTPGYLRRFRIACALGALCHAAGPPSPHTMLDVIREARGAGLHVAAVEDVLRDLGHTAD